MTCAGSKTAISPDDLQAELTRSRARLRLYRKMRRPREARVERHLQSRLRMALASRAS